jgi:hypothetical protein
MTNELTIQSKVSYQVGEVQFYNYEEILQQATELAELIKTVEVDENSIKGTKKLLASVNKKVKELEDERIRIKNELLTPYLEFEKQIKTISSVVKESDNELRSKVRELEELERQEKYRIIEGIFNKRISLYPTLPFLVADKFITPQHLNKTSSLNKIELEMVQWLEQRKREVEIIALTDGADMDIYSQTLDLVLSLPRPTVDTPKITYKTIQVDEARIAEVKLYLKLNGINHITN